MDDAAEMVAFWLDETGPAGWYGEDDTLDATIRRRFGARWEEARDGGHLAWMTAPAGALGYILLTDQFPRNMFRGEGRAFATDRLALAAAKSAIDKGWDRRVEGAGRQFFYLPFMHSESLVEQDRCVRLVKTRMPEEGGSTLLHARAHREIIRRFGRFPHRNAALGRATAPAETAYLDAGGYGGIVRALQAAVA